MSIIRDIIGRASEPTRDGENVLRFNPDDMPTRPNGTRPPPAPVAPHTTLPEHIAVEVAAGQGIFEVLMELENHSARERVMAMVETMMELYAPKPAEDIPDPQGNPV